MKKILIRFVILLFPLYSFSQELREFGDAPEGVIAYPSTGLIGAFPTCINVGPGGFVLHNNFGAYFLTFDFEMDGNAGLCPGFSPYDMDECFGDGDAGLLFPEPFTIVNNVIQPCPGFTGAAMGVPCQVIVWGQLVDINVVNFMPNMAIGWTNVIIDWNQNGVWGDILTCPSGPCPEHVLINHPVMNGFSGPLSLTGPPNFLAGPVAGFYWARFTISEQQVPVNWNGAGTFEDGESEDYLIYIGDFDYGDAPEGALAYPVLGINGNFPTCVNVGAPGTFVKHATGNSWFGPIKDLEAEGNQGACPVFTPNLYNHDECFQDNDAGLITPSPYTITGPVGQEMVVPCISPGKAMDTVCKMAQWGPDIDITVNGTGFVNVLVDWNRDGQWALDTTTRCNSVVVPENVLVDFPVTNAMGVPLSTLFPPAFLVGPDDGYVWVRFSITPVMLGPAWTGGGTYSDGESEDYLLEIADDMTAINLISPDVMVPFRVTPNPVKDMMTVEYSLKTGGAVSVDLIDPEGRVVRNLAKGPMAKGSHRFTVDASSMIPQKNSGFFVVRLTADGRPAAYQKVIIAR
jgi:hypothetical protein